MLSKAKYPFSRYWSIFLTDSWKTPSGEQNSEATSYTTTDNHPAFPMPCKWAIDFPEVTWGYSVLRPRKFAGTVGTVKKWTAHKGEARPFPPNLGELLQPFAVERDMADAPMWWLNDIERGPPWPTMAHLVKGNASKFACTAFPAMKTFCWQAWHVNALKDTAAESCLASANCKAALLISAESNVEDIS